jgi:rhodanese-related sulfurtransferase
MQRDYHLIDVRTAAEYQEECLPQSINLPLDDIRKIACVVPDTDATIYIFCETGKHSGCACTVLQYLGYERVSNLGSLTQARAFLDSLKSVCHNAR